MVQVTYLGQVLTFLFPILCIFMQTQVDEGLSAPESKGEVHKKPASFDPADIAALTVAMNEYAEASKY